MSWDTDEEALKTCFSEYGSITEVVCRPLWLWKRAWHELMQEQTITRDRDTGRSRGIGFVTSAKEEEATSAVEGRNGCQ